MSLRILHVVPHLDRVGGYERQALLLARHQADVQGLHPLLLTHHASDSVPATNAPVLRPDTRTAGAVPVVRSAQATGDGPTAEHAAVAPPVHRLERGLRRYHPGAWWRKHRGAVDVVHAHAFHKLCGQVVALAAHDGVPAMVKVATPADVDLFAEPARWRELVEPEEDPAHYGPRWRWMAAATFRRLRRAVLFLALNDEIAARLQHHGLPCARSSNGVDSAFFAPATREQRARARAALGLHADALCVAFVGRLVQRKDVACVLAAMARLPEIPQPHGHSADGHAADVHLLVCGDGPQAGALRAQSAGVRVHFVEHQRQAREVRDVLHAADVFAHASRSEGFPNALLEALACGLPAVLSDIAGHRDGTSLPGDVALIFPPGDAAALAAALARLLASASLRAALGAAARTLAAERYDIGVVARAHLGIYEQLVARRPLTDASPARS